MKRSETLPKWSEDILSKTDDANYYKFLRFFDKPIVINEEMQSNIFLVNHWMDNDYRKGRGLLIVGNNVASSHLLYLVASRLQLPITFSKDMVNSVFEMINAGQLGGYQKWVNNFVAKRHAIDNIGEEQSFSQGKMSPIADVVSKQWEEGKGIIGHTALTTADISAKYGHSILNMIYSSCLIIKVKG